MTMAPKIAEDGKAVRNIAADTQCLAHSQLKVEEEEEAEDENEEE